MWCHTTNNNNKSSHKRNVIRTVPLWPFQPHSGSMPSTTNVEWHLPVSLWGTVNPSHTTTLRTKQNRSWQRGVPWWRLLLQGSVWGKVSEKVVQKEEALSHQRRPAFSSRSTVTVQQVHCDRPVLVYFKQLFFSNINMQYHLHNITWAPILLSSGDVHSGRTNT